MLALASKIALTGIAGAGVVTGAIIINEVYKEKTGKSLANELEDMWRIWEEVGEEFKLKNAVKAGRGVTINIPLTPGDLEKMLNEYEKNKKDN